MSLSLSTPLSLYSIPILWAIGFYPLTRKSSLLKKTVGEFDLRDPRGNIKRLAEQKVDPEIIARATRMDAAHLNGNEALPLWSIAILSANVANIDPKTLNIISIAYITLRLLYNWIYINQTSYTLARMRSATWITSTSLSLYLLVKAAGAFKVGK